MVKFYIVGALIISLLLTGWKITSLRSQNDQLIVKNDILKTNILSLKEQVKFEEVQSILQGNRMEKLNTKLVNSEKSLTYLRGIFNGHNFSKLLSKKPQLITNRMDKATKKVLEDLENASN